MSKGQPIPRPLGGPSKKQKARERQLKNKRMNETMAETMAVLAGTLQPGVPVRVCECVVAFVGLCVGFVYVCARAQRP